MTAATVLSAAEALLGYLKQTARARGDAQPLLDAGTPVNLVVQLFRTPGRAKGKPVRMCVAARAGARRTLAWLHLLWLLLLR